MMAGRRLSGTGGARATFKVLPDGTWFVGNIGAWGASAAMVSLGGDLLVESKMLFDRGNALKGVIDFFLKAGDILDLFSEIVEIEPDRFKFALYTCQLPSEVRDVVFGRHLAFDIGDVFGDRGEAALDGREDAVERRLGLLGRLLLCGHMPGV
jgi:hypothetical protein